MKTFEIATLGCKVNQYETEAMSELFLRRGYSRATDGVCDVYVVNTCTVTRLSDSKSRQQISKVKRKNPDAIIAVVGCYSQVSPEDLWAMPDVDVLMGTKRRSEIVDLVEEARETGERINAVEEIGDQRAFDTLSIDTELSMTRAYIKIQEGCDMFCTYCIIPYARGHIASRPLEEIVEEAKRLADNGFHEVVLTGIHVASYGREVKGGKRLIDVIEGVAQVEGIERIRLSSIEPRAVTEDFLSRMRATGKACDHFHMSLQSGSDAVLQAMNRKYDTETFAEKAALIREYFPEAGLTTDVIVGFPGETEAQFEETMAFCASIGFSKIHVFSYSARKGTPAATFRGQIPGPVKKKRSHALLAEEEKMRFAFMDLHIGTTQSVLFEEFDGDAETMLGYTTNYMRVSAPRDYNEINSIVDVEIVGRDGDMLLGVVKG